MKTKTIFLSVATLLSLLISEKATAQIGEPYIHDPSTIMECEGKYYTFGTGGGGLISEDGWTWNSGGVRPGRGAAPDAVKIGDRYLIAYSATGGGLGGSHRGTVLTMWNKTLDPNSPDFKYTKITARMLKTTDCGEKKAGTLDIAVVMLRHVSNYTDFAPLAAEPDVRLRPVRRAEEWGDPDVVMLPGSKSVVPDLDDLRRSGLADNILGHAERGKWIFGICGGLQILGRAILDPHGIESAAPEVPGLGLMDLRSTFAADKTLVRVARAETPLGVPSGGYEIHHGLTDHGPSALPLFLRADRAYLSEAERICGYVSVRRWATYLHGVFDDDAFRRAWLDHVRADIGLAPQGRQLATYDLEKELDRLADIVREHSDMETIYQSMGLK